MAKGIDIGTCFIVGAEIKDGKEVFTVERDAFFSMPKEDFAEEMLDKAKAKYITRGNMIYVVGEDAMKFAMLTGKQKDYRRPMAKGVLNPGEEEAISMLEMLIRGIAGPPAFKGEVIAATVPAAPLGDEAIDTTFHRVVVERCLKNMGYDVKILNEALALIFNENPSVKTASGESVPFTGVGISFGAGMTNLVVAWRAQKLFEISVCKGGDWIDERVAAMRNQPQSKVTAIKENPNKFRLDRSNPKDPIHLALEIYYEELIRDALTQFNEYFRTSNSVLEDPLDFIIGGGTASVPGFIPKFKEILDGFELPFPKGEVRLAKDPVKAVAAGSLVAAISHERKKLKQKEDVTDVGRVGKVVAGGAAPSGLEAPPLAAPVAPPPAAPKPPPALDARREIPLG